MITAEQVMEEVRESRRRMSAECDHDPARYTAYLMGLNAKYVTEKGEREEAAGPEMETEPEPSSPLEALPRP